MIRSPGTHFYDEPLFKGENLLPMHRFFFILFCLIGSFSLILWVLNVRRLKIDTDLRFFQLRALESKLAYDGSIFISGYDYFFKKKTLSFSDSDIFEQKKWNCSLSSMANVLSFSFIVLYIAALIAVIFFWDQLIPASTVISN